MEQELQVEEESKKKGEEGGGAGWIVTFADLMSLLLTFFVLLLSMSTIDATKFRKISGSLRMAFGVQRVSVFDEPPKGSSFVKEEYSSGGSSSAPLSVDSQTVNLMDPQLQSIQNSINKNQQISLIEKEKRLKSHFEKIYTSFSQEIERGDMELLESDNSLVVRVFEEFIFPDNEVEIQGSFNPAMEKFSELMKVIKEDLVIVGHSDDREVHGKYKNNWSFSSLRAQNLAQALMGSGEVEPERVTVQFHGPTRPIVKNNSESHRRKNRRIEIVVKS